MFWEGNQETHWVPAWDPACLDPSFIAYFKIGLGTLISHFPPPQVSFSPCELLAGQGQARKLPVQHQGQGPQPWTYKVRSLRSPLGSLVARESCDCWGQGQVL